LSNLSDGTAIHHPQLDDLAKPRLKVLDGLTHASIPLAVNAHMLGARAGIFEF
jgi:hypothetical protein